MTHPHVAQTVECRLETPEVGVSIPPVRAKLSDDDFKKLVEAIRRDHPDLDSIVTVNGS